jgi:hypothetical protein
MFSDDMVPETSRIFNPKARVPFVNQLAREFGLSKGHVWAVCVGQRESPSGARIRQRQQELLRGGSPAPSAPRQDDQGGQSGQSEAGHTRQHTELFLLLTARRMSFADLARQTGFRVTTLHQLACGTIRLLRAPGETQLMWVRKFDENLFLYVVFAGTVPAGIMIVLLPLIQRLTGWWVLVGLAVALVAFIGTFVAAARWLTRKLSEFWDRYLGYFGERYVAEWLDPLREQDWRVFHDVPGEAHGKKFNIDHVAVGLGGVFVIETKTRRKGAARPGRKDNEVFFDGRVLDWPWGEDNHGLEQAERNAIWLTDTLKAETGERVHVTPILTLPGWWVEVKPAKNPRLARVANPKWLPKWLGETPSILNATQVAVIAAKLEERCRDVKYGA